jgi:uncharacterized phage-associated protein
MATILDVAAYILRKRGPMTAMKLQKLCYYAYGYHLAWENRMLFPEHFEAWANGPVSRDLYREHRSRFNLEPGDIPGNPAKLDRGERESVDLVLEGYGGLTAHQLSLMTHRERPWVAARRRSRAGPLDRSTARIRDDDIIEYFDDVTSLAEDAAEG